MVREQDAFCAGGAHDFANALQALGERGTICGLYRAGERRGGLPLLRALVQLHHVGQVLEPRLSYSRRPAAVVSR